MPRALVGSAALCSRGMALSALANSRSRFSRGSGWLQSGRCDCAKVLLLVVVPAVLLAADGVIHTPRGCIHQRRCILRTAAGGMGSADSVSTLALLYMLVLSVTGPVSQTGLRGLVELISG